MRKILGNVTLVLVTIAVMTVFCEIAFRLFMPISVTNVGYVDRPNGEKYGWGFGPNELVRIEKPDTGDVIYDRVNSEGWRDEERDIAKPDGTFRILVMGDSMTFGYIVAKDEVFTKLLQDKLRGVNPNVEVLNIAYAGWGTDQIFEALKNDGAAYKPDLIIYYFNSNDVLDNVWHEDDGKFGARKPFYYEVTDSGLVRRDNPRFIEEQSAVTRKYLISKSEILKRAWLMSEALKHWKREPYIYEPRRDSRILHFLKIDKDHPLFAELGALEEKKPFDEEKLAAVSVAASLTEKQAEDLALILTNISGNEIGLVSGNEKPDDFSGHEWKLTAALIDAKADTAKQIGADFAIFSELEEGRFQWDHEWRRVADDPETRAGFFRMNDFVRQTVEGTSIEIIPSPVPVTRAHFDSHANVAGNEAIAENLYRYITARYPAVFAK